MMSNFCSTVFWLNCEICFNKLPRYILFSRINGLRPFLFQFRPLNKKTFFFRFYSFKFVYFWIVIGLFVNKLYIFSVVTMVMPFLLRPLNNTVVTALLVVVQLMVKNYLKIDLQKKWYFFTKIVLTYSEKKLFYVLIEKNFWNSRLKA